MKASTRTVVGIALVTVVATVANVASGYTEITDEQHAFTERVESTLRELCMQISETYTKRKWNKDCTEPQSGCDFDGKQQGTGECRKGYLGTVECGCTANTTAEDSAMYVDFNASVMMVADRANASSTYHEALCRQDGIDAHFAATFANITFGAAGHERNPTSAVYAGFPSGIARIYPGYSWRLTPKGDGSVCYETSGKCEPFDARTRPWYSVPSKGPLDAVFIIDRSRFQGTEKLNAVKDVMATIGSAVSNGIDYYRVISFDEDNLTYDGSTEELSPAYEGAVSAAVNKLTVTATTASEANARENFVVAVEAALEVLEKSAKVNKTSHCRQTIAIFASVSDQARVEELLKSYTNGDSDDNNNKNKNTAAPKIFVYTMTDNDVVKKEHKAITCAYNGLWNDLSDAHEHYEFVEAGLAFSELFSSAILTSPIIWFHNNYTTGLGEVYTAARACRWVSTVPPKLIAVAGIDFRKSGNEDIFTENFLKNVTDDNDICPPFELNKFEIENLRDERCEGGADIAMISVTVPISVILVALTIFGLILSRDTNKFIFDWEKINSKNKGKSNDP